MQDVHSRNVVVRVYYRYRVFMGICCICCEVLYLALYLQHWQPDWSAWSCVPQSSQSSCIACSRVYLHLGCTPGLTHARSPTTEANNMCRA